MGKVYTVDKNGQVTPLVPYECRDEEKELQDLLERCPDLLVGEQIDPLNPRRWLQIQREMPVPDPGTGQARWSIDFLFADQDAVPTFVEVKRYADTRARREVIGQMFEYAANGHYYWVAADLRAAAEKTAAKANRTLAQALAHLGPEGGTDAGDFFERVQANLKIGQIRLLFFLERAPDELKSLVEFLNRSLERIDVLLVQAQLFRDTVDGTRKVLVPTLFGYSEEIRQARRLTQASSSVRGERWNDQKFDTAVAGLDDATREAIGRIRQVGFERGWLNWGTGQTGSFYLLARDLCPRSFLVVNSQGRISINFGYINGSPQADELFASLKKYLSTVGFSLPADLSSRHPGFAAQEWVPKVDSLVSVLASIGLDGTSANAATGPGAPPPN
ncbi:MAG: hypothetical protein HYX46_02150 [Betaproteobacteria bacterium]|nr:hypothetical protein [Betaproteobacteria bacterium]